jgi:hypothetical protein
VIVLDTTVLVYAVGIDQTLAEPNRRLLQAMRDGKLQATTTPEVIQEFAHVYARRRDRAQAVRLGKAYTELLSPLCVVDRNELDAGLSLFERVKALGAFDAVLAAVALQRGADAIVSADHAFAGVPRLRHIDPLTSVDALLS